MKKQIHLLACSILLVLSGCGTLDQKLYDGYGVPPLDAQSIQPYAQLKTDLENAGLVSKACFAGSTDDKCRIERNQTIAVLSVASASLCQKHRQSIYGRDAASNITFGTLTNLFAGAAAVASSESAKSLYAALALFSNSERSLVNETVYKQMIVTAVDQKIAETVQSKSTAMATSLSKPISDYGLQEALRDMVDIHTSCSFMNGLRLALAEGTRGATATKMLTLRANLASIDSDITRLCVKVGTAADTPQCTQAQTRSSAVSSALQALEVSGQ